MNTNRLILLFFLIKLATSNEIYIGVIEQNFHHWEIDKSNPFIIRIIFKKEQNWKKCIECSTNKINWTICFDSKKIGTIASHNNQILSSRQYGGTHLIDDINTVPKIGKQSREFSGWICKPVYRPLIVNSSNFFIDPENLKPYTPTKSDLGKVITTAQNNNLNTNSINIYKYTVNKSYKSILYKLISITFENNQKAELLTGKWKNIWFFIDSKECNYLDSDMLLIDAGDYDNDGKSEVIFKVERYNRDGYIIYFNFFKNKDEFFWGYH